MTDRAGRRHNPWPHGWWLRAAVWIGTDNLVVWAEVSGSGGEPTAPVEQLTALVSDLELRA